ncbi:MAG: hypothetical protein FWE88_07755, partial [Phycisphaerae bacterium]|nr:hypothetical protein [Phycisphaerae bacterium]
GWIGHGLGLFALLGFQQRKEAKPVETVPRTHQNTADGPLATSHKVRHDDGEKTTKAAIDAAIQMTRIV